MLKNYKVLLSAYACEPEKGSEPGVGWNFAMEIAKRGHEVWVLTRENNESRINKYFDQKGKPENLHFEYYDLPSWLTKRKKYLGVQLYYLFWQLFSVRVAKNIHKQVNFDLVHHITFGVLRHPNLLFKLRIPFYVGPIGGGEYMPNCFKHDLRLTSVLKETIRKLSNRMAFLNPFVRQSFNAADKIFCTTAETESAFPKVYSSKICISQAIGTESVDINSNCSLSSDALYVGRLEDWKGVHLAIRCFHKASKHADNNRFTIIGSSGNYRNEIKKTLKELNNNNIVWNNTWISDYQDVLDQYNKHGFFIFLSLHEAGGMVILEALMRGLPVICFDIGGPGQIIDESCGRVISTQNRTKEEIENSIVESIKLLQEDKDLRTQLSKGAILRAKEYTWSKAVYRVYKEIENNI